MDFDLRTATADDQNFLTELFCDVRGPDFAALPPAMRDQLLAMQQRAQALSYAENFPAAVNQILWIDGQRAGRLLVSSTAEEIQLVDVALLGRFRGQGIGTRLVGDLCRSARASKVSLRLSVQAGNPALRLYQRLGFVPTGSDSVYLAMELGDEPEPAASVQETAAQADVEQSPVEPGLTRAYFRSLQGRSVSARSMGGVQAELKISLVEPLAVARRQQRDVDMGDSFRVELLGPLEPVFQTEMIEIASAGDAPQELFVSPLGPQDGAMQYEAIFNRAQPAA
jgi:ribosomal protein S18 acetylase RimI-like enzyme